MTLRTDREKIGHILRRFGLGSSESELDYYSRGGLSGAINSLVDYEKTDEGFDIPVERFSIQDKKLLVTPGIQIWWIMRLITTRRPLQEKMTLFWHDHFATSASKVNQAPLMYQQNETLRRNATGKFKDLLLEVSQDPAMLFWLDNQFNVKGKPNENFAREVMELFTLGIGNYSEKDIQEAARAFTGWTFRRIGGRQVLAGQTVTRAADFLLARRLHDDSEKTIFGKTGNFGGEDVVAMLCDNPQTAKFITTKIWEWFAYPNPEPALIDRLATKFRQTDLDIKELIRAMLATPEFYSDKAVRAIYKNPVDFVIPTIRQLGLGEALMQSVHQAQGEVPLGRFGNLGAPQQAMKGMGMELLFPPDVAGWDGGQSWISSATMVERIQWGERLFGQADAKARRAQMRFDAAPIFANDPSSTGITRSLLSIFDAPLPAAKIDQLEAAAKKAMASDSVSPINKTAATVCKLMFGAPEFQFC